MSLVAARGALEQGGMTVRELVEACLRRVEKRQPEINAFIDVRGDDALQQAMRADTARGQGRPLDRLAGVPLAHKDMFFRQGKTSTCGSKILANNRCDITATVLERLDAAGALDLGTLNMSEFALGPAGHNEHFGHCRNPCDPQRISGGSSSGSAAAVAAGMVFAALGSDTAGSVRLPAAMCGLVGIKPTLGRVSCYGGMPLATSFDTFGVLARYVADCALVFDTITGADPKDLASSNLGHRSCFEAAKPGDLNGLIIGRPTNYYFDGVDNDVSQEVDAAIDVLSGLGAECIELMIPHHETIPDAATAIITSEAAALHAPWLQARPEDYSLPVRERIETGFSHRAPDYLRLLAERGPRVRRIAEDVFGRCDVLVAPVLDIATPTVAETDIGGGPAALEIVSRLNRKTRTINYLGFPAMALPAGRDRNGMPVSLQLIARPFAEHLLFRIGGAFEAARGMRAVSTLHA